MYILCDRLLSYEYSGKAGYRASDTGNPTRSGSNLKFISPQWYPFVQRLARRRITLLERWTCTTFRHHQSICIIYCIYVREYVLSRDCSQRDRIVVDRKPNLIRPKSKNAEGTLRVWERLNFLLFHSAFVRFRALCALACS